MQINNNFSTTTPSYRNNFQTTQTASTLNFSDNLAISTMEISNNQSNKIYTVTTSLGQSGATASIQTESKKTSSDYYNETIDKLFGETSNSVDWNADGTSTLTEQQIEELKSKYDVNNLSDEDYYNLIADLTNINVLSMGNISSMSTCNIPVNSFVFTPCTLEELEANRTSYTTPTTLLESIERDYESLGNQISSYSFKEFWLSNSSVNYNNLLEFTQKETERLENYDKFFSIINSLK